MNITYIDNRFGDKKVTGLQVGMCSLVLRLYLTVTSLLVPTESLCEGLTAVIWAQGPSANRLLRLDLTCHISILVAGGQWGPEKACRIHYQKEDRRVCYTVNKNNHQGEKSWPCSCSYGECFLH